MPRSRAVSGLRVGHAAAHAGHVTVLGLAEPQGLRAGEDQGEALREVGPGSGARARFLELGQRRVPVIDQHLRVELDLARGRAEPAGGAAVQLGVLAVARRKRHTDARRFGAELLERDAARRELVAERRLDVTVPEMLADADVASAKMMSRSERACPRGGTSGARSCTSDCAFSLISNPIFRACVSNALATEGRDRPARRSGS
jgi:hypothetical protein